VFLVYRGRRYENNDIFLKLRTCSLHICCGGLYQLAGWLAARPVLLIALLLIATIITINSTGGLGWLAGVRGKQLVMYSNFRPATGKEVLCGAT